MGLSVTVAAPETKAIMAAEEHNIYGGLGSAVAEVIVEETSVPMERVGVRNIFAESSTYDVLLEKYGFGVSHVADAVRKVVKRTGN